MFIRNKIRNTHHIAGRAESPICERLACQPLDWPVLVVGQTVIVVREQVAGHTRVANARRQCVRVDAGWGITRVQLQGYQVNKHAIPRGDIIV